MAVQVWNANTCNAVVGAFNLQGSAWDRSKRQYATYTSKPPTLSTEIRVRDVPVFSASQPSSVSIGTSDIRRLSPGTFFCSASHGMAMCLPVQKSSSSDAAACWDALSGLA